MKKPYFNRTERLLMINETISGNMMLLTLAWMKLKRDLKWKTRNE